MAYSYPFFVRTQTMVHYIKWLAEEVDHNITDVRNGAWVPNSENLSDYLKHAVEQTRAGQTADNSGYRKPDEVPDRPGSGPDKANAQGEHMEH